MSHSCVDSTLRPLARATVSGDNVGRLFRTGVPSMMNSCVAPELAIAYSGCRTKVAPAKLVPRVDDVFVVTMVRSLSQSKGSMVGTTKDWS